MTATTGSSAGKGGAQGPYRVMVVDDSAVVRGMTSRFLEEDPELEVVASVSNGQRALDTLDRAKPEVTVLDIEMPVMDGLTALPKLLAKWPSMQVIMSSTLTKANADVTIKALRDGAADYVTKPSNRGLNTQSEFQNEIRTKVKALAAAVRRSSGGHAVSKRKPEGGSDQETSQGHTTPSRAATSPRTRAAEVGSAPARGGAAAESEAIRLRKMPDTPPQIVAIGSSTGGPQALFEVIANLGTIKQPILITQHMPATFTALLADHIGRQSQMPCAEARDGDRVAEGHIYVAPGGYHMTVKREGGNVMLRLSDGPAENFCRPSADPMLRSVVEVYGNRALAVILTGMGSDGLKGCQALVDAGGYIVAQDEPTSVVWGMPGAVAKAGLCSAVLPVKDIASQLRQITMRSAA